MDALDANGAYEDCIQWSKNGLSFKIVNPIATEKRLLTEVFNGEKLHSFIRKVRSNFGKSTLKLNHQMTYTKCFFHLIQIYKWGFVACPCTSGDRNAWKAFSYPSMFQRGKRELCRQMRRGCMRVEELHFTNSKTEESNSMKNGSGVSITPNTSGSMSSPANGQEDLDEHLLPSYYFDDCSPNALSDIVSVDQSISTNTWPYHIDGDLMLDDDTRELLRLALDNGVFD